MTELLQALYRYAMENRALSSPEDKAQYRESEKVSQSSYQKVCALLTDEGRQYMEKYVNEKELIHDLDLETVFRAGLAIGLELSRL